jgi:hypothetical protein
MWYIGVGPKGNISCLTNLSGRRAQIKIVKILNGCLDTSNTVNKTMSEETKESLSANDLLKNSSLYREFQAEREEILKHKWIESEKAGRDIGFERALTDWIIRHRSKWRKSRQLAGH